MIKRRTQNWPAIAALVPEEVVSVAEKNESSHVGAALCNANLERVDELPDDVGRMHSYVNDQECCE